VKAAALLAMTLLAPLPASAQDSAAFLKLGVGARAMGMGGAYTAVADDVNAVYWNPAGLSRLTQPAAGATHADLFANTRYDFLAYAQPTRYGAFAAAAGYLSQAAIPGRDNAGTPAGNYNASDAAVYLAYAHRVPSISGLGLGGGIKYIRSTIADASAQSWAFDLGACYAPRGSAGSGGPAFALAVTNLGPGMKFLDQNSPLPLTIAWGGAYRLPFDMLLALDYKYRPHDHPGEVGIGAEYQLNPNFAVRAGYDSKTAKSDGKGGFAALSGFTAGFGINIHSYSLDYSIAPMGELGNVQRFSLAARFGSPSGRL
jgi:hypothetical protein